MKPPYRIALGAALVLSGAALAADWPALIETADVRLLLNPAGRKTPAGVHLVQYRIDFKQPRTLPDGKSVGSSTMSVMVSCPEQTVALTETVANAEAGGKGAVVLRDKVASPVPKKVTPGSSDELIYKAVCTPAPAPAPAKTPAAPPPAPAKK